MRVENIGGTPQKPIMHAAHIGAVTIHNVHILDSSGSMSGVKYNNAIKGINADIAQSKSVATTTLGLTSTMTIVEFSNHNSARFEPFMKPIALTKNLTLRNMGGKTALYETIGLTIEKLLQNKQKEDKVLLKIFTDGEENNSLGKYASPDKGWGRNKTSPILSALIKKVQDEDNFTVTFVGTVHDTQTMIKNLNVDESNTLVHDNTAQGVKKSFETSAGATMLYMASASRGEDVSKNFYTKTLK